MYKIVKCILFQPINFIGEFKVIISKFPQLYIDTLLPPKATIVLNGHISHEVFLFCRTGYAAKSHYSHGGGVNFLCLQKSPNIPSSASGAENSKAYIYGVEYEHYSSDPGSPPTYYYSPVIKRSMHNEEVPCAVCHVTGRSKLAMIPGRKFCNPGWKMQYYGYLVSQRYNEEGSTFECLDRFHTKGRISSKVTRRSTADDLDGGLFYSVEARCGSLPCPPYKQNYEIYCVVCTR